jgi:ParB-like nuclease family protein
MEDQFAIEMWPVDRPKPYPKNARRWTAIAIEKVANSILEFGFRQPIVVDARGVIIIGHLRQVAARHAGLLNVPVHVASDLSPIEVKALRIADNRTHEEAEWDLESLGADLLALKVADFDLSLTAFDPAEIIETVFADMTGPRGGTKNSKEKKQPDGLEFKIVVDCIDEAHQTALLGKFAEESLICHALIS